LIHTLKGVATLRIFTLKLVHAAIRAFRLSGGGFTGRCCLAPDVLAGDCSPARSSGTVVTKTSSRRLLDSIPVSRNPWVAERVVRRKASCRAPSPI